MGQDSMDRLDEAFPKLRLYNDLLAKRGNIQERVHSPDPFSPNGYNSTGCDENATKMYDILDFIYSIVKLDTVPSRESKTLIR